MAKKKDITGIGESPLVGGINSTINPDKLEFSRFTDLQKQESASNPIRIVIYIVVVIGIGIATALIVRNLIVSNNTQNDNAANISSTTDEVVVPQVENMLVLSTSAKPDATVTNIAKNEDYKDTATITAGDSTVVATNVSLDKIDYTKLSTFSRFVFTFSGNTQKLPLTTLTYSSTDKKITLNFGALKEIDETLRKNSMIETFAKSINYIDSSKSFEIILSEAFKYRVANDKGNLILDVKSTKELEKPVDTTATTNTPTTTPTETPTTTPTTTPTSTDKPAAPFYTNEFNQKTQYISSKVTENNIAQDNYWAWDEGSFFELSFGKSSMLGDKYVPNAKAYLDTSVVDKSILILEISNLSQAVLASKKTLTVADIEADTKISLAGSNFVKIDFVELKNGIAKYKIELKKKADFKLLTQDTYDGKTQIVSIQIKD